MDDKSKKAKGSKGKYVHMYVHAHENISYRKYNCSIKLSVPNL